MLLLLVQNEKSWLKAAALTSPGGAVQSGAEQEAMKRFLAPFRRMIFIDMAFARRNRGNFLSLFLLFRFTPGFERA